MTRYAYTIPAELTPHGRAIHGNTKASSEDALRAILAAVYGAGAWAGATVWEVDEQIPECEQ